MSICHLVLSDCVIYLLKCCVNRNIFRWHSKLILAINLWNRLFFYCSCSIVNFIYFIMSVWRQCNNYLIPYNNLTCWKNKTAICCWSSINVKFTKLKVCCICFASCWTCKDCNILCRLFNPFTSPAKECISFSCDVCWKGYIPTFNRVGCSNWIIHIPFFKSVKSDCIFISSSCKVCGYCVAWCKSCQIPWIKFNSISLNCCRCCCCNNSVANFKCIAIFCDSLTRIVCKIASNSTITIIVYICSNWALSNNLLFYCIFRIFSIYYRYREVH